jgi:tRNA modification GTPase
LIEIKAAIAAKLEAGVNMNTPAHAVISERHRNLLEQARGELEAAREQLTGLEDEGVALAAEHLRDALESLGQVTGRVYHDELLDNVFSRFCIGK